MKPRTFFFFSLGILGGFLIAKLTSGGAAGETGWLPSVNIHFGNFGVHLHHWLWATSGAATMLVLKAKQKLYFHKAWLYVALGLFVGIALQGFQYDDWDRVFYLL